MNISSSISALQSHDANLAANALDFLYDLFEYGEPISDAEYLFVVKEITEMLDSRNGGAREADLLAILNKAFYSDSPAGQVSPQTFKEAISHIVNTGNPIFKEILKPLLASPALKEILNTYFEKN
jgi:hypothetical protein